MKTNPPSIFEYNDFRKFIADYQNARHEKDPTYTKSRITQLLGLPNSRSYLTDVLRNKIVSPTFVERFIKAFGFNQDEANYFRTLVKFNQADNPDERELCFEQLIALNKTPKRSIYRQAYHYYKHWNNGAMRALLNVYDFDGKDFSALSRKLVPSISVPLAKKAFVLLLKMQLIAKNAQGFYKPTDHSIVAEEFVREEILKQYQIKCLELAKSAVISDTKQTRIITTNTISISNLGLARIEKQIERFRAQIRSLVHKDEHEAETVYQIDILLFPMMK
jgi:uncharacterized protein (TIGR02147 family)